MNKRKIQTGEFVPRKCFRPELDIDQEIEIERQIQHEVKYRDDDMGVIEDIKYFYSKKEAKEYYSDLENPFWFKFSSTRFAAVSSRKHFIDMCVKLYDRKGYLRLVWN